jgi:hypothetical protein
MPVAGNVAPAFAVLRFAMSDMGKNVHIGATPFNFAHKPARYLGDWFGNQK